MAEQVVKKVADQRAGRPGKTAKAAGGKAVETKAATAGTTKAASTRSTSKSATTKSASARSSTTKAKAARSKMTKVGTAGRAATKAAARWRPRERAEFVVAQLGGPRAAARVLRVAPSQPTRWVKGDAVPGPEAGRAIADLDHVFAVALQVWEAEVARDWMFTGNAYLDGARPVDVVRTRGSAEVVEALRAEATGANA